MHFPKFSRTPLVGGGDPLPHPPRARPSAAHRGASRSGSPRSEIWRIPTLNFNNTALIGCNKFYSILFYKTVTGIGWVSADFNGKSTRVCCWFMLLGFSWSFYIYLLFYSPLYAWLASQVSFVLNSMSELLSKKKSNPYISVTICWDLRWSKHFKSKMLINHPL